VACRKGGCRREGAGGVGGARGKGGAPLKKYAPKTAKQGTGRISKGKVTPAATAERVKANFLVQCPEVKKIQDPPPRHDAETTRTSSYRDARRENRKE